MTSLEKYSKVRITYKQIAERFGFPTGAEIVHISQTEQEKAMGVVNVFVRGYGWCIPPFEGEMPYNQELIDMDGKIKFEFLLMKQNGLTDNEIVDKLTEKFR